jgi:hypothetical protein
MPTAAATAVAPAKRPATERPIQPARRRRPWVLAELAEGIEEVGMAAARADSEGRGDEDEPAGDEQRPQRDDAEERAGGNETAEHDGARSGDCDEGAAGRQQPPFAGHEPGEEREPQRVSGAGRDERV